MGDLDTNAYYALGIPFCLAAIAVELLYAKHRRKRVYSFAGSIGNVSGGLGEVVIGIFLGTSLYALYAWAYHNFALFDLEGNSFGSRLVTFLAADFTISGLC